MKKRILPVAMAGLMVLTCMPAMAAEDPWSIADATVQEMTASVDGEEIDITVYTDYYLEEGHLGDASGKIMGRPSQRNEFENAKVDIVVPEGATANSPVIYMVNNGGWQSNAYDKYIFDTMEDVAEEYMEANGVEDVELKDIIGTDMSSAEDLGAMAIAEGYIVVTAGLRTRGMETEDGTYNHSAVTVADAKAVIRYLKHNGVGNTDMIFINGTSGGGALSVAIASSGNSADFNDDLEAIGACMDETDDIFGVIAYCPITDLGHADGAYEFTYSATRDALVEDNFAAEVDGDHPGSGKALSNLTISISDALAEEWVAYVNGLGVAGTDNTYEDGVVTGTVADEMKDLLIESLNRGLKAAGSADAFEAVLENYGIATSGRSAWDAAAAPAEGWQTSWIVYNADKTAVEDIDMAGYLYYVAAGTVLKNAPSFTNQGTVEEQMNENNLFGKDTEPYGFLSEIVWDIQSESSAIIGKYADWDAYWEENGDMLTQQANMTDSIYYLTSEDGDSAPYWWVRHGSIDRDTSFANQTLLKLAMDADDAIETKDFEFAFNKPHTGDYALDDVKAFIKESVADATPEWSIADADVTALTYTIDGEDLDVMQFTDYYLANTGDLTAEAYENAKVNVYVPEGATEDSPVLYMVNNSGWRSNSYSPALFEEGVDIVSEDKGNMGAMALKNGYIVVDAGLRSRGSVDSEGNYNHSPVTVADAKAVIKYLRFNEIGDTDKIFITGTSGGGALSAAIGASGNSADFYEELYTIGAAGMTDAQTSTIKDDVYGVIAYCPITDLAHSDGSYEFTYAGARLDLLDAGLMANDKATTFALSEDTMEFSPALAADWTTYVNAMNLKNEAGDPLTAAFDIATLTSSGTLYDGMLDLAVACFQEALDELGYEEFIAQLEAREVALDDPATTEGRNAVEGYYGSVADDDAWKTDWLTFSADKKTIEAIDAEGYLYYVAAGQVLKPAIAFTNQGVPCFDGLMFNENNLFGQPDEAYGFNLELVFNASNLKGDAYADWDAYWEENGELITLQGKMVDSIAYLTDAEGESDAAPYWYVRHGSNDRDTGFANQTLMYYALLNNQTIETIDFEFEFGLGHTGGYGVPEVETFIAKSLDGEGYRPVINNGDADNDGVKDEDEKSPTTGEASALPMMMVVVVAAAGVAFATRRRVVR